MGFVQKLIYPLFGLAVLLGYGYVVRNAIEPFQVSSEQRTAPRGPQDQRSGSYRPRSPGVFFFGGFGGK